jgi:hypothetical protein
VDVGELRKACPHQGALVPFQVVVTLLCDALHVERSQPYIFGLGGTGGSEELLAMMEPWQWIFRAVILWETQLVGGGVEERADLASCCRPL